jgi:hypothetical protein
MGRKLMTQQELSKAKDSDLRNSLQAMQRAAVQARQLAMQTNTGIVIMQNEKILHLSAEQLRREQKA